MLRISEFARAGNVTIRALRFYDQVGLLRPAHVSPETGYRRYTPAQMAELNRIQAFKDMGFALGEIANLLRQRPTAIQLRQILQERRKSLEARVREDIGRLERIEARLRSLESLSESDSLVLFGKTERQWVVSAREKLENYEEADALLAQLAHRVDPQALAIGRATIWHSCLEGDGRIDCEALCFLKRPIAPSRGLRVYAMPPARIAFAYHYGAEESICRTYESITKKIASRGFQLAAPKREVYWPGANGSDARGSLTEVQFPIVRARAGPRAN
jgi:DNA-binding transcriptional MerR regulator